MPEATTRPPRIRRRGRPPKTPSYTVDRHGDVVDFEDFDDIGAASVVPSSLEVRARSRVLAGGGW